ncbi:MAG TPA: glucose-6-phosphate dehydrogenase assembly protein OpcA [Candidatus Limnocylindrales bacterium]|nr:glucose-6-phosphate dehydrogenase assembly protein OpcA [Candidatus Limnocylindrales bacterium]
MAEDLTRAGGADGDGRALGEIIAVGSRPAGGGRIELAEPPRPGEPTMRWLSRAQTIDDIEKELGRIWAQPNLVVPSDGERGGRHIAARTSVMNLVVVARRHETGERTAETISRLTGRHPSRTLIVLSADADGPPWLDARIQAHCVLPRVDAPETCSEQIFLTAGGETGRHLSALVAPLLIHDLPVTVWWPDEPPFESPPAIELFESTDRLVVDGSTWSGDGFVRLRQLAGMYDRFERISIRDFALVRQSRWREAIATVFDIQEFLPFLSGIRRVSVTYAAGDETGAPGSTNVIKPLYHVAWLASRLGLRVVSPLAPVEPRGKAAPRLRAGETKPLHRGLAARLSRGTSSAEVGVVIRPVASPMPAGTTLRVEILAERRGSELRADVTAEADNVHVHAWRDGVAAMDRTFKAPRRTEVDLLGEALELGGRDPMAMGTIRMAAALVGEAR